MDINDDFERYSNEKCREIFYKVHKDKSREELREILFGETECPEENKEFHCAITYGKTREEMLEEVSERRQYEFIETQELPYPIPTVPKRNK
ncbi:MAG: hypothetical protein CMB80_05345 [Flammeovirgaceae bacterium]|nr:hypothetical protein [Flammeovirgaceae bacterium]|tara:strand:+ start:506 stop:781 length:276 start_codon:yes stop_codon:yes gene_type:complete